MESSPRPAPGPRPRDAATTRAALLEAAEEVFARAGYSGARVDDIAACSGYNKSLIFQHFGDKAGLYRATIRDIRDRSDAAFCASLNALEPDHPASREALEHLLRFCVTWVFDHFQAHPRYLRLLSWEQAEGWQTFLDAPPSEQMVPEQAFRRGLELFSQARAGGLLRPDLEPATLVATLYNLPLVTLGSLPRFERLVSGIPEAVQLERVREQTLLLILHMALPDQ